MTTLVPFVRAPSRSARATMVDVAVHATMVAVMAGAMAGRATALQCLGGAFVLVALSLGLAPAARRNSVVRLQLVDLWGMILLLLVPVIGGVPAGHVHGAGAALSGAVPGATLVLDLLVVAGWAAVRVPHTKGPVAVATAVVTAAGLLVMIVLCI